MVPAFESTVDVGVESEQFEFGTTTLSDERLQVAILRLVETVPEQGVVADCAGL